MTNRERKKIEGERIMALKAPQAQKPNIDLNAELKSLYNRRAVKIVEIQELEEKLAAAENSRMQLEGAISWLQSLLDQIQVGNQKPAPPPEPLDKKAGKPDLKVVEKEPKDDNPKTAEVG